MSTSEKSSVQNRTVFSAGAGIAIAAFWLCGTGLSTFAAWLFFLSPVGFSPIAKLEATGASFIVILIVFVVCALPMIAAYCATDRVIDAITSRPS